MSCKLSKSVKINKQNRALGARPFEATETLRGTICLHIKLQKINEFKLK